MDRIRACGACDPGSNPGKGTNLNIIYLIVIVLILAGVLDFSDFHLKALTLLLISYIVVLS